MDRQEYRRGLAAKLRGARAEAGLSQTDVERAMGPVWSGRRIERWIEQHRV
jgi:hypothetical protein